MARHMSEKSHAHYLYILNGPDDGECYSLVPGIYLIGRAESHDIVLKDDNYVSGTHAELEILENGVVTLTDKGSRNGTFLLGDTVTATTPVRPGDIFRIGQTFLKLSRRKEERMLNSHHHRAPETILVVDIVGSSKIAQMMGDQVAGAIKNILRDSLTRNLAEYPAEYQKSTGDGYMLIFAKPLSAIKFAQGMLSDITGDKNKGFHIRIGINYGETHRLSDGDRRGSAVDMAFRIESVKIQDMHQTMIGIKKEQMPRIDRIFISESVQKLVARKSSLTLRCIGFFELKGFNGRHKVFEVIP